MLKDITPSTRDLAHFLSPNPGKTGRLMTVAAGFFGSPSPRITLKKWEDEEIAALVVRPLTALTEPERHRFAADLASAAETLSCPFLAAGDITGPGDVTRLRALGFDGAITGLESLSDAAITESASLAETLHFRLIFTADRREDFSRIEKSAPRFAHVTSANDFTSSLTRPSLWLIGPSELQGVLPLKGLLYDG